MIKKTIARKIAALTKKTKENGKKGDVKLAPSSSLHQVIKPKEQAALFMKLLKEA
ncbi:MAG: hypothetical protein Q8941_21400 [Bacteroidota bacterium]|nr:hypothetical protein [Bacteroidota bacterium]